MSGRFAFEILGENNGFILSTASQHVKKKEENFPPFVLLIIGLKTSIS
jgi:hypothetical protein